MITNIHFLVRSAFLFLLLAAQQAAFSQTVALNTACGEDENFNPVIKAYCVKTGTAAALTYVTDAGGDSYTYASGVATMSNSASLNSVFIRKPGSTGEYYYFTVSETGKLCYHEVNTITQKITSSNNVMDAGNTGYHNSLLAIDNRSGAGDSWLYAKRLVSGTSITINGFRITSSGVLTTATVLATYPAGSYTTAEGEMQLSGRGDVLVVASNTGTYNSSTRVYAAAEIRTFKMANDYSSITSKATFTTDLSPNVKVSSLDLSASTTTSAGATYTTYVYFVKRSFVSGSFKDVVHRVQLLTPVDPTSTANHTFATSSSSLALVYTYTTDPQVRKARNGSLYIPSPGTSNIDIINGATGTTSLASFVISSTLTGGMPLSTYMIFASAAEGYKEGMYKRELGDKTYEVGDHLGNVTLAMSDLKRSTLNATSGAASHFSVDVRSMNTYYVYGAAAPGMNYVSGGTYRYGFNGKEREDDVAAETGVYDFGARLYNPAIGRWWSTDPLADEQPGWSPYKAFLDNPIGYTDPDGRTECYGVSIEVPFTPGLEFSGGFLGRGNISGSSTNWNFEVGICDDWSEYHRLDLQVNYGFGFSGGATEGLSACVENAGSVSAVIGKSKTDALNHNLTVQPEITVNTRAEVTVGFGAKGQIGLTTNGWDQLGMEVSVGECVGQQGGVTAGLDVEAVVSAPLYVGSNFIFSPPSSPPAPITLTPPTTTTHTIRKIGTIPSTTSPGIAASPNPTKRQAAKPKRKPLVQPSLTYEDWFGRPPGPDFDDPRSINYGWSIPETPKKRVYGPEP